MADTSWEIHEQDVARITELEAENARLAAALAQCRKALQIERNRHQPEGDPAECGYCNLHSAVLWPCADSVRLDAALAEQATIPAAALAERDKLLGRAPWTLRLRTERHGGKDGASCRCEECRLVGDLDATGTTPVGPDTANVSVKPCDQPKAPLGRDAFVRPIRCGFTSEKDDAPGYPYVCGDIATHIVADTYATCARHLQVAIDASTKSITPGGPDRQEKS